MTTTNRTVIEHTLDNLVAEVAALTLDGFVIDPTKPADILGFGSTLLVHMYRDADTVEAARLKLAAMDEKPKRTKAEILADARAAKAQKAARLDTDNVQE